MPPEIELRKIESQPVVSIRRTTTMEELAASFGEILPRVAQELAGKGVAPTGQPFGRYHSFSPDGIDLEAGLPVEQPVQVQDPLQNSSLPAAEAAVVTHIGPYDTLKKSYELLENWIRDQGRTPAGGPWELYLTDPYAEPDSSKWKTEIFWPLG